MTAESEFDETYYAGNGQLGDRPALGYYVRLVRRYIAPSVGGGPYLDYGCGTGYLVRRLSTLGPAAGFEVSNFAASAARRLVPGAEIYQDAARIPDSSYGAVTAIHVLEHLDPPLVREVLATWRRVLRPGGRVLAVMPDPAGKARRLVGDDWLGFSDPTHINLQTHAQWRERFAENGFRVLRDGSDGLWNVPYSKLPRLVDAARYAVPALAQFLSGRLVLPPGSGESSIFVLGRSDDPGRPDAD